MTRILSKPIHTRLRKIPLIFSMLLGSTGVYSANIPVLEKEQINWLGEQIFTNECNQDPACLTAWNEGEDFPSLGIGHFIWYQAGQQEIFREGFPDLLQFLANEGADIPLWLKTSNPESPWPDRNTFLADMESDRMQMLRTFLLENTAGQTAFIISRYEDALEDILKSIEIPEDRDSIEKKFYRVASTNPPHGIYALIDYNHFKGSGISSEETYQGIGWGLKQVLLEMEEEEDALIAFVNAARQILARRVDNAPPERNESRWLNGWYNRLNTYLAK